MIPYFIINNDFDYTKVKKTATYSIIVIAFLMLIISITLL